jgi:phage shock protein PspC (stress-responsive transcriptional regulator)
MMKAASKVQGVIRLLTIATVAGLIGLMVHAGTPANPEWWFRAIPFAVWIIGPTLTAYGLAHRFKHRPWFVYAMVVFLTVFAVLSVAAYYDALFVSKSSTAALAMVMVPFFQWAALVIIGIASAGVAVWRDRHAARE